MCVWLLSFLFAVFIKYKSFLILRLLKIIIVKNEISI